jgi:hypothetical protein
VSRACCVVWHFCGGGGGGSGGACWSLRGERNGRARPAQLTTLRHLTDKHARSDRFGQLGHALGTLYVTVHRIEDYHGCAHDLCHHAAVCASSTPNAFLTVGCTLAAGSALMPRRHGGGCSRWRWAGITVVVMMPRLGAAVVASFLAAVLTEIYLCDACSCQAILRRHGRAQPRAAGCCQPAAAGARALNPRSERGGRGAGLER